MMAACFSRRRSAVSGALVALAISLSTSVATADDPVKAAELYEEGNKAFDAGDLYGAELAYEQAWEHAQSFDLAANLGAAKLKLDKAVGATFFLGYALKHLPVSASQAKRDAIAERYEQARAQVGAIKLSLQPGHARALIDGREAFVSPVDGSLLVLPGLRKIEVAATDHLPHEEELSVGAGETKELSISLTAAGKPPTEKEPAAASPPPATKTSDGAGPIWPIAVGAGVSVALAGVGVGFLFAGSGSQSDADELRDSLAGQGTTCSGGCAELTTAYEDADSLYNTSIPFFVGAGAVALGTVAYALFRPTADGDSGTTGSWRVVPVVSPQTNTVQLTGTF